MSVKDCFIRNAAFRLTLECVLAVQPEDHEHRGPLRWAAALWPPGFLSSAPWNCLEDSPRPCHSSQREPPCHSQALGFGLCAEWQSPSASRVAWPGSTCQEGWFGPVSSHVVCQVYTPCTAAQTSGAFRKDMHSQIRSDRPIGSRRLLRVNAEYSATGSSCSRTT